MRAGAYDYLVKPVEKGRLVSAVKRAIETRQLREENCRLRDGLLSEEPAHPQAFAHIVAGSSPMQSVFRYAEAIAGSDQPVLVTGETGVGKELIAPAIHELSGREGPFVAVNVASLDDTIFADALFGHSKGAYTGAEAARTGLVAKAAGGTLFLDEIGELDNASQVKLLRLLQEGQYYPLGSDTLRLSSARIIVATNADLRSLQETGRFRRDLYYRLQTHEVHIPPLRKRREDLPALLDHFLTESAASLGKRKPTPPPELLMLLNTYAFPGNVRELRAMVYDAVSRHQRGKLSTMTFREAMDRLTAPARRTDSGEPAPAGSIVKFPERLPTLKDSQRILVDEAMKRSGGNQSSAARLLGISRQALNKRLRSAG